MLDYIKINKDSWDKKLVTHLASDFYNMDAFMSGKSSLNKFELDLLGDVKDKRILHLQCHFGQDSISLSRMGARVTAIDFSESAIAKAKKIADKLDQDTRFICVDIYSLPSVLNEEFDIVFTSYGTIIWLPDIIKWAAIVSQYMAPKAKFVFVDFHPFVWMYDDNFSQIIYKYSSPDEIVENETGSYADKNALIQTQCVTWNHGIAEVINALIHSGLAISNVQEYDYAPYPFISKAVEIEKGKYRIKEFFDKLPLVYSIAASKKTLV